MKRKYKLIFVFVTLVIIVLSIFVVAVQYELIDIFKEEKKMPLSVKIFADVSEGTAPFLVNFSSIVANNEGDVKYHWDLGNGNSSEKREPTTVYSKDGTYTCKLKITDGKGETETDSIKILAKKNKPPVVTLSINQNTIDRKFKWVSLLNLIPVLNMVLGWAGNQQQILDYLEKTKGANCWGEGRIVVTAQISDPEDDEIVSYNWTEQTGDTLVTFGGDVLLPTHNIKGNDSIRIPELYTWMPKEHVVTLTVTDSAGNRANATIGFMVSENIKKVRINQMKNLILTVLLDTIYEQYLDEAQKHLISDPIWAFVEPINKILSKIPIISTIWSVAYGFLVTKFPQPVPLAELNYSFDESEYDHSETVNQNGGVTEEVSINHWFNIKNIDKLNTAKDIYIILKNKFENEEGLNDEIEKEELVITLEMGESIRTLYFNEIYTEGVPIGDLDPGAEFSGKITVKFLEADNDTFKNNQNYSCNLYVRQAGADYKRWVYQPLPDEIKFNIRT